jgi:Flp pilus assembly pilin Flp
MNRPAPSRPCAKPRGRLGRLLVRLHHDEQGYTLLDYAMVFGFVTIPLILLFGKMFQVISTYFSMIAYYVTWPFL